MILFKSHDDLKKLDSNNPAYPFIEDLVQRLIVNFINEGYDYDPDANGFISLIEEHDVNRVLEEIWPDWNLLSIP